MKLAAFGVIRAGQPLRLFSELPGGCGPLMAAIFQADGERRRSFSAVDFVDGMDRMDCVAAGKGES